MPWTRRTPVSIRLAFSSGVAAAPVFAAVAPLTGQTPARRAGLETGTREAQAEERAAKP